MTERDVERDNEAQEDIQTRPDIVSVTLRMDDSSIRRYWLSGPYICIDIQRPQIRTNTPTK